MKNRKAGRLYVSIDLIENNPKLIAEVFAVLKFIPVRAECLYFNGKIDYVIISENFKAVAEGVIPPEYELIVSQNEDGSLKDAHVKLKTM